jgi:hypothetical protein
VCRFNRKGKLARGALLANFLKEMLQENGAKDGSKNNLVLVLFGLLISLLTRSYLLDGHRRSICGLEFLEIAAHPVEGNEGLL